MFDFCSLNSHIIEIDVTGPGGGDGRCGGFSVKTVRCNPASSGGVTGKQTYASFLSSLLGKVNNKVHWKFERVVLFHTAAKERGGGVHLC